MNWKQFEGEGKKRSIATCCLFRILKFLTSDHIEKKQTFDKEIIDSDNILKPVKNVTLS